MRTLLIFSTILGSWLGMQAMHESGHVLGAWASGGRVARVVLNPLTISRTDLAENPKPLFTVWAGPIFGALAPILLWSLAAAARLSAAFVLRFFAGFCLLANGAYVGVGAFFRVGDSGEMLKHGSAMWQLWLFGAIAAPMGLWLWHGQGVYFGLGQQSPDIKPTVAYLSLAVCLALLATGFLVGGQ